MDKPTLRALYHITGEIRFADEEMGNTPNPTGRQENTVPEYNRQFRDDTGICEKPAYKRKKRNDEKDAD